MVSEAKEQEEGEQSMLIWQEMALAAPNGSSTEQSPGEQSFSKHPQVPALRNLVNNSSTFAQTTTFVFVSVLTISSLTPWPFLSPDLRNYIFLVSLLNLSFNQPYQNLFFLPFSGSYLALLYPPWDAELHKILQVMSVFCSRKIMLLLSLSILLRVMANDLLALLDPAAHWADDVQELSLMMLRSLSCTGTIRV